MVAGTTMLRRAALLSLLLLPALFPLACGTGVKGINECRDIEFARCEASAACGTVDDVDACKRFYRDHCLHGLPLNEPGEDELSDCVSAIKSAGECAKTGKEGPDTAPWACPGGAPAELRAGKPFTNTCAIVKRPWDTTACFFLSASSAETGAGGQAGAAGK